MTSVHGRAPLRKPASALGGGAKVRHHSPASRLFLRFALYPVGSMQELLLDFFVDKPNV